MKFSIMDKIQKIIESKENYIYQHIINNIDQYVNKYCNEYQNRANNIETSSINEFKNFILEFMDNNNIKITI